MRLKVSWMLFVMLLGFGLARPGQGEEIGRLAAGTRAGLNATDNEEDLVQAEAFFIYDLSLALNLPRRWVLGTRINGSVGALRGGGQTGFVGTIGPGLFLSKQGGRLELFAGISPTTLSRDRFGDEYLGGPLPLYQPSGGELPFERALRGDLSHTAHVQCRHRGPEPRP